MGNDFRVPSNFLGNMSYGTDFMQMQSMLGTSGLGGFGTAGLGNDFDFTSLFRNLLPQYTPSYQPTISTQTTQVNSKEREKKIEELDNTSIEAEKEVKTAEHKLEESKDAEKTLKGQEFGLWDTVKNFGIGVGAVVTDLVCEKNEKGERALSLKKALTTAVVGGAVLGGAAVVSLLCPPAAPLIGYGLTAVGAALSVKQVTSGISGISNAKTYADKEAAMQSIGEGLTGGALSYFGYGAIKAAQAAKAAQTGEAVVAATKGLTTVANEAGKASLVTDVVKANGLTENAELLTLVSEARQSGKSISVADLFRAGVTDGKQSIKLHQELNAALKTAETAGATAQDAGLLSSINREAGFLKAAGTDSKAAKNAKESLTALLKLTTREGLTPEMEAALAKIKADFPEIAKELKLGTHQAQVKLINDMAGREQGILDGLKGITGAGEKEKEIIEKATKLLANITKGGVDRTEILATLKELQGCESVSGPLEVQIISARKALATTAGQALKATGRKVLDGASETPELLAGTAKRIAAGYKDQVGLNARNVRNLLPQAFNQIGEEARGKAQALQFAQIEKDTKDKTEAVAEATKQHDKAVKELASLYKVDAKDSHGKAKSIKELSNAITIAKAGEAAAKAVLAAAEKEKAAKAAA